MPKPRGYYFATLDEVAIALAADEGGEPLTRAAIARIERIALEKARKFLTDRGVDPKRIFVESRTDAKVTEPRLDVQLVGRPAPN